MHREDTITAIATPPGEGGVAIIRISGREAESIANQMFSGDVSSFESHKLHYGRICDLDTGLLVVMRGGRSYSGDLTVEIHCHGGSLVARQILERALALGARAALPGEFTFRAYMNGKLDLAQAEAVQELIAAKNGLAMEAAGDQLQGRLSRKVKEFQRKLTEVAAILEAAVDFPEEGLELPTVELQSVIEEMEQLRDTFSNGRLLKEGIAICLVGAPNVGKSSLMNALLDRERAIVTHLPGTTRDLLEEPMRLGHLQLRLIDTAGLRDTQELIEQEGIRRSREAMESADLTLLVLDASRPPTEEERALMERADLHVWNKSDLAKVDGLAVSAKERTGLEALQEAIEGAIWREGPPSREELLITNVRHKEALEEAIAAVKRVAESEASPEFLCIDMRMALEALGRIIGTHVTEEILTAIFQRFCIGK